MPTVTFNRFVAIWTLAYKELKRTARVWAQSILPSIITTFLYFMVFGKVIGHRIGSINNLNYLSFIAPGLIMLNIINNAYSTSAFALFVGRFMHHIEEILVSPMSLHDLYCGLIISAVVRGVICGGLVLGISLLMTPIHIAHPWLMILISILAALIFSIAGLINGIYAKSFDSISIIPTFILTPLMFLGGVFYSLSMLPKPWSEIAAFNPIYYLIDAFRSAILGTTPTHFVHDIALFCILSIVLYAVAFICGHYGSRLRQ